MLTKAEIDRIDSMEPLDPELLAKIDSALIEFCKRRLVNLQVYTRVGLLGSYWYGTLTSNNVIVKVTHKLTVTQATCLNIESVGAGIKTSKEGDISRAFFSRESLIETARLCFPDSFLAVSE